MPKILIIFRAATLFKGGVGRQARQGTKRQREKEWEREGELIAQG